MSLLQINVDEKLKKAIQKKADQYGVPASSLVRIVLVRSFLEGNVTGKTGSKETTSRKSRSKSEAGNVFNAARDNRGKGIKIDDLISVL